MRPFMPGLSSWLPCAAWPAISRWDSRRGLGAARVEIEDGADVLQADREADVGVAQPRSDQRLELAHLDAQAVALLRPVDRIVLLPQEVVLHVPADLRLDRELLRDDVQGGVDADLVALGHAALGQVVGEPGEA